MVGSQIQEAKMNCLLISCGRYDYNMMNYLYKKMIDEADIKATLAFPGQENIEHKQDCVIILGDRYEHLIEAAKAYNADIPVVHLHGGEITRYHKDDGYRWAISHLADLHLAATEKSKDRLFATGLGHTNIFNVGALGVEVGLETIQEEKIIIPNKKKKLIGIVWNPQENEYPEEVVRACFLFSQKYEARFWVSSGEDPVDFEKEEDFTISMLNNLGPDYYHLLAQTDVVIGNSSSLVIEAPVLGCGIVLVGNRQTGRELASNIQTTICEAEFIFKAAVAAMGVDPVEPKNHPYYQSDTANKIIEILEKRYGN